MSETKETTLQWYAVRTMASREKAALENIQRDAEAAGVSKWINDILLPTEKVYKLHKGKKTSREKLVFPGYLYIEANLIGEVQRTISRSKFVIGFAGDRNRNPIPIKKHEINRILGRIEEEEKGETEIPFIEGEQITITDGPFNGFEGTVENINQDKQELSVIVTIFGRETPVKLSYLQVDKV